MFEHIEYIEPPPSQSAQYKMLRNFSNSNPSLQQLNRIPNNLPDGGIGTNNNGLNGNSPSNPNNVSVEYEVSVPIIQSYRHTPYHSLWNLNQGFV